MGAKNESVVPFNDVVPRTFSCREAPSRRLRVDILLIFSRRVLTLRVRGSGFLPDSWLVGLEEPDRSGSAARCGGIGGFLQIRGYQRSLRVSFRGQ